MHTYLVPKASFSVASTLAKGIGGSFSFRILAAASYWGASCLQCPHLKIIVRISQGVAAFKLLDL